MERASFRGRDSNAVSRAKRELEDTARKLVELYKATVASGSKNVTVAPGAQSGLFKTIGRPGPPSLGNSPGCSRTRSR